MAIQNISLDLYLSNLRHAVVIARPDGTILYKNNVFSESFLHIGTSDASTNIHDILRNNFPVLDIFQKAAETVGSFSVIDIPVAFSTHEERSMDVDAFPILSDDGQFLAIGVYFHDRTGEAQFEEQQKRMDRIHYLGTIAAGLAHEIRNPLSGIKGASQLMVDVLKDQPALREYAEIIQKEVVRVDRLMKDLLHFTKPRTLKKKSTNVNHVLHDIVLLERTVNHEKIQFLEEYDPSLPEVSADPQALSQVFLNLIKNAREAIKDTGKVTVRSRVVTDFFLKKGDKRRQVIGVEIQDTGEGIDLEALKKIFIPFFTTKAKGSGLGLAVCHQLVQEHEGNLQVKSERGRGTTFSVFLPV